MNGASSRNAVKVEYCAGMPTGHDLATALGAEWEVLVVTARVSILDNVIPDNRVDEVVID